VFCSKKNHGNPANLMKIKVQTGNRGSGPAMTKNETTAVKEIVPLFVK